MIIFTIYIMVVGKSPWDLEKVARLRRGAATVLRPRILDIVRADGLFI